MKRIIALSVLAALSCTKDASKRTADQLAALEKKRAEEKKAEKVDKLAPLVAEVLHLPAPYDESGAVVVLPDGPCPEGLWAFFPGEAPGATPDEKKANAARRKDLVAALTGRTMLVKLRAPATVTLSPYDAPNGKFLIDVVGTIDCTDSLGRIALAWTDAKATTPGNSAAKEGADLAQNVWVAPPVSFELFIKSLTEAKTFNDKNRFGLSARVAFTAGKAEVDKKVTKVKKVKAEAAGEKLSFGGGSEDWGAGRLLRGTVQGVRVATEQEKKELFNKK
jgi:hypothetical protein